MQRIIKKISLILFCMLIFLSIFDCAPAKAESYKRIISLAPSITEILYAFGSGDEIAGVTTYCNYPEEAKTKPKVGGFTNHNIESIILLKPDLVIMTPNREAKLTHEKLKQLRIDALVVPLYRLDDLKTGIVTIGKQIGREQVAFKLADEIKKIAEHIQQFDVSGEPKKVAFITWKNPLILPANGTFEDDVITLAGGQNIVKHARARYPQLNIEILFDQNPDVIIDASSYGADKNFEEQKNKVCNFWNQYPLLRAVKTSEIYVLKGDFYSIPGPRTIQFMTTMEQILSAMPPQATEFYERVIC